MNKYAIYDQKGNWLYDIHADSPDEAIAEAKKSNRAAYRAELVDDTDEEGPHR